MNQKKILSENNIAIFLGCLTVIALGIYLYNPNKLSAFFSNLILEKEAPILGDLNSNVTVSKNSLKREITELSLSQINNPYSTKSNIITDKDPFKPFDMLPSRLIKNDGSKLEEFNYADLTLTAVLANLEDSTAIVEDKTGHGYYVKIGTKIGNLGGAVSKIEKDKIIIEEETLNFDGQTQVRVIEMMLRTPTH